MLYSLHILDYLDPVNTREISNDEEYKDGQVGKLIQVYEEEFPDLLRYRDYEHFRGDRAFHQLLPRRTTRGGFYSRQVPGMPRLLANAVAGRNSH